jgi:hypothetical protein
MAYTFEYNSKTNAVELVFVERVSGLEVKEATSEAIKLLKKHGVIKGLIDTTRLEEGPNIADIYNLPAHQYVKEDLNRQTLLALIVPESIAARETTRFYETVCVNRGWLVRTFLTRDEALEWLMETD